LKELNQEKAPALLLQDSSLVPAKSLEVNHSIKRLRSCQFGRWCIKAAW